MKKWLASMAAAAVVGATPTPVAAAAASDVVAQNGGNAPHNRILRQNGAGAAAGAFFAAQSAPRFRPPAAFEPDETAKSRVILPQKIALVLPANATGAVGRAASKFYEGCLAGLERAQNEGKARRVRVDLFAGNGDEASMLAAYERARAAAPELIVGPLQTKNARALLRQRPRAPIPTLLLQPGAGENYYVFTMNLEQEAALLARRLANEEVLLVSNAGALSRRQAKAFADEWHAMQPAGGGGAGKLRRFYAMDPQTDWQKLFESLAGFGDEENEDKNAPPPPVVFAAGNGKFIRDARNFTPQGLDVYGSGLFYSWRAGDTTRFLDNLHVTEMPWFFNDTARQWGLNDPLVAELPALLQRHFALGADACRIAQSAALWLDGWEFDGVSGRAVLRGDVFERHGVLARWRGGRLLPAKK